MKLLTILIFSGDRLHVRELLDDISIIDQKNLNIRIVDWTENEKILIEKKKIYYKFKKKIKNSKIYYQKGSPEFKNVERRRFITKFKSKYIIILSDDDRICIKKFSKIYKYLKLDYSGITISFNNFKRNEDLKKKYSKEIMLIRDFDIFNDINRIGFQSCQIIKTDLINKIFNKEKKNFLLTHFPLNFIILRIIKDFKNWKITNLKCIFNRLNLDFYIKHPKQYLDRLNSEYLGYFIPIKNNFKNLGERELEQIYKLIFFKNIVSWLFLSIKNCRKRETYNKIKNSREIIKEPFIIKVVLFIIYVSPIFLLEILRVFRKIFRKL
jgi:hypothetical protein